MDEDTYTMRVEDILYQLEVGGLPQTTSTLLRASRDDPEEVGSACAVGLIAYNIARKRNRKLRLSSLLDFAHKVEFALSTIRTRPNDPGSMNLTGLIEGWNDQKKMSYKDIAAQIRIQYPEVLDKEVTI